MPAPARISYTAQLRAVRRWTIAVAVFYAAAAVALVLLAAFHQASSSSQTRADTAIMQRN